MRPFPRTELARPTLDAAARLLGASLVRAAGPDGPRRVGRIVEVEAYLGPEDRASHARAGRTARTAPMFGPPGIAYVYLVYGMYDCLNVVTEPDGRAGAVLIRAVEPIEGVAAMRDAIASRRVARQKAGRGGSAGSRAGGRPPPDLRVAAGPGLVAAAFSIDRSHTGTDLCDPDAPLRLELPPATARPVALAATPRIGVGYAAEPWVSARYRLVDAASPSLSRPVPGRPVPSAR